MPKGRSNPAVFSYLVREKILKCLLLPRWLCAPVCANLPLVSQSSINPGAAAVKGLCRTKIKVPS